MPQRETDPRSGTRMRLPVKTWSAVLIYSIVFVISVGVFLSEPKRSVTSHYEDAASRWIQGESLYGHSIDSGHGFLYFPHAAVLHTPFVALSQMTRWPQAGDVVWRLGSWFLFALACWRIVSASGLDPARSQWRMALVASLLAVSALRIGQSTLIMSALMMLGVIEWQKQRFDRATVLVTLAVALKPLAIVAALLLFAVSPQMRLRLTAGLGLLLLLPFAMQSPSYVMTQYLDCIAMLRSANDLGNNSNWAQLFGMLHFFGISIDATAQTLLRLGMALVTLGMVFLTTLRADRHHGIWLYAWAAVYLMLFNPRTENSTYCLLGPVLAWVMIRYVVEHRNHWMGWTVLGFGFLIAGSYEIGKHFTPDGYMPIWLAPLSCCFFTAILATQWWKEVRESVVAEAIALGHSSH